MKIKFIIVLGLLGLFHSLNAQFVSPSFGKGLINITALDSSFSMKMGLRFQNLVISNWKQNENYAFVDRELNFLIRRSRLKFDGFAFSPKLTYKFELGLSNRDMSGGVTSDFSGAPRYILDASVTYKFHKNWSVYFGQGKLPGNRERVISSGNLQFVDRSRLNSRFNIDRDFGVMIKYKSKIATDFILKQDFSISQGEGRNITSGNRGGLDYTYRLEALPLGNFESKGDYVGSAVKRESTPKLSIGVSYDINVKAARERGQNGNFIPFEGGFEGRTLYTVFADMMFKYEGLSIMAEYANRTAQDDMPVVMIGSEELGVYYTGTALNLQAGYFLDKKHEIALRYTVINADEVVDQDDTRYTVGVSRFIVGHKLKLQSDITYRDRPTSSDELFWRFQMDLHF